MKKIAIIISALIFGIWGCSKDSMLDPSNPDNGNADLKKSAVKIFVLKAVKLQNHPTENPMVFWISGNISHMGLIDPASTVTITSMTTDPENPGKFLQTAIINMIGADGSSLQFETTRGEFFPATGYSEHDWDVVSGTGRFEGATGWYKSTSQLDNTTMINYVTGYGEIYVAKK
ncbi:MAG: hypothetical protein WC780_07495 [Lentimicrobiaceae bacterium]|jgi:hypothetical protein